MELRNVGVMEHATVNVDPYDDGIFLRISVFGGDAYVSLNRTETLELLAGIQEALDGQA